MRGHPDIKAAFEAGVCRHHGGKVASLCQACGRGPCCGHSPSCPDEPEERVFSEVPTVAHEAAEFEPQRPRRR